MTGPLDTLERLLRRQSIDPPAADGERCDLCGAAVPDGHRHVLDERRDELLCTCQACTLLFEREAAARGHYRCVPRRRVRLPDLGPRDPGYPPGDLPDDRSGGLSGNLGMPVGLAFLVPADDGTVLAHYPSPMGATRWEVAPQRWRAMVAGAPALRDLRPRVEALLVNTVRGRREYWIVPVDDCYRLVAVIRREWTGLSGGTRVWPAIDAFFADLDRPSGSPAQAAPGTRRPPVPADGRRAAGRVNAGEPT